MSKLTSHTNISNIQSQQKIPTPHVVDPNNYDLIGGTRKKNHPLPQPTFCF